MMQNGKDAFAPFGLPNIGNTCFLNSILQQIYRMTAIRNILVQSNGTNIRSNIINEVGKLFFQISSKNKQIKFTKECLKNIAQNLQQLLFGYKFGRQYDSFQTLLGILNEIIEWKNEVVKYFEIVFSLQCSCSNQITTFCEITIQNITPICCSCNKQSHRTIIQSPKYLIVRQNNGQDLDFLANSLSNSDFSYRLQSRNIYIGNGHQGHYYTVCRQDSQLFKIDDSKTTKIQAKELFMENCLFSIYQKCKKFSSNQHKNDPQNVKFQKNESEKGMTKIPKQVVYQYDQTLRFRKNLQSSDFSCIEYQLVFEDSFLEHYQRFNEQYLQ